MLTSGKGRSRKQLWKIARKKQRAWKMKIEELEGERLVKRVYSEEVIGRRRRGRPRKQ